MNEKQVPKSQMMSYLSELLHATMENRTPEMIPDGIGIDEIIDTFIPQAKLAVDVHTSLLSLPYLLGLNNSNIFQTPEGYIVPDDKMVEEYKNKYFDNDKIKVGIKWRGNTTFDKDRVIPAELFNKITNDERAKFYSLQTFEGSEDAKKLNNVTNITTKKDGVKFFL